MILVATIGRTILILDETDFDMRADSHLVAVSPLLPIPDVEGMFWGVDAWLEVFWLCEPFVGCGGLVVELVDGAAPAAASLCCCCLNSLIPCKMFG